MPLLCTGSRKGRQFSSERKQQPAFPVAIVEKQQQRRSAGQSAALARGAAIHSEAVESLKQRLNELCERHDLEWLVLPCVLGDGGERSRRGYRYGPYWCALMEPGPRRSGHRRSFAWNRKIKGWENDPYPDAIYFHPGPLGRKEAKRLLLAQLEEVAESGRPDPEARATARQGVADRMRTLFPA